MSIRVQVKIAHLDYETTMYLDPALRASEAINEIKSVVKLLSYDEPYCLYCEGRMNRTTLFIAADETLAECGLPSTGGTLELKHKPQPLWFLVDRDGTFNPVSPKKIHLTVDLHDPVSSYINVIQQKMGLTDCEYLFLSMDSRKPIKLFVPLANQMIRPMSTIVLQPVTLFEKRTLSNLEGVLKKGWLSKRSQKKKKVTGIKKRYVVLTADLLYYFKTDTGSPTPLGVIPLDYVEVGSSPDQKHMMLTFRVVAFTPDPPVYIFDCDNVTEMAHWFSLLKQRCNTGKGIWNTPLVKLKSQHVPLVVELCVMYLRNQMKIEGLFRVKGSQKDIDKVRDLLDGDAPVQLESARPHTMAGVLLLYLKTIPEPVCIRQLYDDFVAASGNVEALQKVILDLPQIHRRVLEYLMSFLSDLAELSDVNLMTPKNLAVIFAPILLPLPNTFIPDPMQTNVIRFMIEEFGAIFSSLPALEELPPPPELARGSPRGGSSDTSSQNLGASMSQVSHPVGSADTAAGSPNLTSSTGHVPQITVPTRQSAGAAAASLAKAAPSLSEATVLRQFVARNNREMSVNAGETVGVISKLQNGWTVCLSADGERKGLVPTHCFSLESSNAPQRPARSNSVSSQIHSKLAQMQAAMTELNSRADSLHQDMTTLAHVSEETEVLLDMALEQQQWLQAVDKRVEDNRQKLSLMNNVIAEWQYT